ncbi:triosephosphate isomerase [Candidatus Methylomirabilis lanthanidiphila]|uniref:Triosephosphate isomerase n=1 Tax=Candidatus Methylomirabilis lanthanidiphila TaxID=2211376 RepID=A0A564ZI35_9BACT|nr:triose-phosphate isomerase [Candidatus Methylomirabilis lanthanidiphila]VUZ84954.1 triosephosphate isomerase [Candidatus Methylomirabilis lanthanidiphila]
MRIPVIAGNWKMYKTPSEAIILAEGIVKALSSLDGPELVVCPPFTALAAVGQVVAGSRIGLGAQDLHWAREGAYTGEVSADMLQDIGCRYAIIGHSERRQYFGETDEGVNKKSRAALAGDLTPIVCVGETLTEREAGRADAVVEIQLKGALSGLAPEQVQRLIFAYEPVWAIGTGKTATPSQAEEMHAHIRKTIAMLVDAETACGVRILYGGSVKPENATELLERSEIDGALIGGASLQVDSFAAIAKAAQNTGFRV